MAKSMTKQTSHDNNGQERIGFFGMLRALFSMIGYAFTSGERTMRSLDNVTKVMEEHSHYWSESEMLKLESKYQDLQDELGIEDDSAKSK